MDNIIKGYNYEIQIKFYIINNLNKLAYLWNEVPENILINNSIIGSHNEHRLNRKNKLIDTGVDIIQLEDNNICSLVSIAAQANDPSDRVCMSKPGCSNRWLYTSFKIYI